MARITFLSTCPEPWGGSEELWAAAAHALLAQGHEVRVLKTALDGSHRRIVALRAAGAAVRALDHGALERAAAVTRALLPGPVGEGRQRAHMVTATADLLAHRPAVAVICQGRNLDGAHLALLCGWLRVPYVVVSQKATEAQWPADGARPYLVRAFGRARRAVFVAEHNLRLTERQIGMRIERAVVLRNPVLVPRAAPVPWPAEDGVTRLACVGRLFPAEKGQDILLEALAHERWRERPVELSLFGDGVNREGLEWLAAHLGTPRVRFAGFAEAETIWRTHHALVLPSRAEGLPLTVVEAMTCGRPAIVTDAGGSAEVIDDGRTGFVAQSATPAAFGDALERAWAVRGEWEAVGKEAARRIQALVPDEDGSPLADLVLAEARAA